MMSYPGFRHCIANSHRNEHHFFENTANNYQLHNWNTEHHVLNGFRDTTQLQQNFQNPPVNETQSEQDEFTGFHINSPMPRARNERDNLGRDIHGQTNSSINNDILQEQYGISQSKPKYPQYAVKSVRISSYRNFPSGITQTPQELAEAGFFYSGQEDIVFCYFCGQGLRSWEPEDNVWIEHARWAPQCIHLLNCIGKDFVKMVELAQVDPEQQMPAVQNGTNSSQKSDNGTDNLDSPAASCGETVAGESRSTNYGDFMTTIAAESVIRNGYDKPSVQKAIKVFIKKEGRTDFSATDILTIIFELEDGTIKYDEIFPKPNPVQALDVKSGPDIVVNQPLSKTNTPDSFEKPKVVLVDDAEAKTLLEENRQLKEQTVCKICLEDDVSIVFLPCGHLCCCSQCAPALRKCPICREFIKGTVKTYLP